MKERTIWGVLGFVIGAVSGWLARALLLPPLERPPIIVRGGSIRFDTDAGWAEANETQEEHGPGSRQQWKQVEDGYDLVDAFAVKIERGHEVIRTFSTRKLTFNHHQKQFKVVIHRDEPRVVPRGLLGREESNRRVAYSGGVGLPVVLSWANEWSKGGDEDSHTLNAHEQVCIEYHYK